MMIQDHPQVIAIQELPPAAPYDWPFADITEEQWTTGSQEELKQRILVLLEPARKGYERERENQVLREKCAAAEEMLDIDLDDLIDHSTVEPLNSETVVTFSPYDPKRFDSRLAHLKAQYQHSPDILLEEVAGIARSYCQTLDSNYRRDQDRRERDTICQGIQQHPRIAPAEKDTLIGLVKECYERYPGLDHTIEIQIGQFNEKHVGMSEETVSDKIQALNNMGCFDFYKGGEKIEVGDSTFTGPAQIKLSKEKLHNPLSIVKPKPQGGPRKKGCKVPTCPAPEDDKPVDRFVTEYHETCDSVHISALPGTPSTANITKAANAIKEGRVFWTGQLQSFAESANTLEKQDAFDLNSPESAHHIYVSDLTASETKLPYKKMCQMTTNGDIQDLHDFAAQIGLRREWFQDESSHPHYDLTPNKRKQAISHGAIAISSRQLTSVMNGQKQDAFSSTEWDRCATCHIPIDQAEDFFIIDEHTGYCSKHAPQVQLQVGMRVQTPVGAAVISNILTRCSVHTDQQQEDGSHWKAFDISEVHPL